MRQLSTGRRRALASGVVAALAAAATLGLLPRAVAPVPALAATGGGADAPLLTASGEGVVKVKPDTAYLDLAVETQAPAAREAQERNARTMDAVLDRLRRLGIGNDDLQTTGVSLYPEHRWDEKGGGPRLTGYRARNSLRVTVRRLDRVGEILDAAVAAGANQVQGVSFTLEDADQARREALARAVRNARGKAETMAGAAGMAIAGVRSVVEGGAPPPPVIMRERAAAAQAAAPTPVIPGDLEIRASVSVTFALR